MRTKCEMELDLARSILNCALGDLNQMKESWPASKRGTRAQHHLDTLEGRIATALSCVNDALSAYQCKERRDA